MVKVSATHSQTTCLVEDSALIALNPSPGPPAYAGPDTVICFGDYVQLGSDGPDSLIYAWSPHGIYIPSRYVDQPYAYPSATTTYSVTVTDPVTNCTNEDQVEVTVRNIWVESWAWEEICRGSSIELTYLDYYEVYGSNGFSVEWSPAAAVSNPHSLSPVVFPDTTTLFTITVTDKLSGCQATAFALIEVNNGIIPNADPGPGLTVCAYSQPGDSIQIGIPPVPGLLYEWYPRWDLSNPYTSNPYLYLSSQWGPWEETFYLYVEDTNSSNWDCNWIEYEFQFELVDTTFRVDVTDATICFGDSVTLQTNTWNPDNYDLIYSWTPPLGLSISSGPNPVASPTVTTNYLLNVTVKPVVSGANVSGCSDLTTVKVKVDPLPVIDYPGINLACGDPAERNILQVPNPTYSYAWYPQDQVNNPFIANPIFTGALDTVLWVDITSSKGCTYTDSVNVLFGDTTRPALFCPADTVIDCTSDTSTNTLGVALALDNCDPLPATWYRDAVTQGCGESYLLERSWYSRDSTGNVNLCIQTITVQDTFAPV
ncbi:MAG TPA: hypothetical protein P5248_10790, partial [Bacteroidales bacterium]|nr:hypothetical protein [Bacteroidales bacterium]